MALRPVSTYSIVAYDADANQFGVAVQSHYFCVGSIVPWAEAGMGAVATQSFAELTYGPLGLDLMRSGKSATDALKSLLAGDTQSETRQVAMVDAQGTVAVHTGSKCIADAGHRTGSGYSVQANLMRNDTIWDAMAEAYEGLKGDLADRLLAALVAAEAAGGDIRGKQSAALLVVGGERTGNYWGGRIFDLRVDDSLAPLDELQRLLMIARAYRHGDAAEQALMAAASDPDQVVVAASEFNKAAELMPDMKANPELLFWYAVALANAGKTDDSLPLFDRVFGVDEAWRELVPRLVKADLLRDDPEVIRRVTERRS